MSESSNLIVIMKATLQKDQRLDFEQLKMNGEHSKRLEDRINKRTLILNKLDELLDD